MLLKKGISDLYSFCLVIFPATDEDSFYIKFDSTKIIKGIILIN